MESFKILQVSPNVKSGIYADEQSHYNGYGHNKLHPEIFNQPYKLLIERKEENSGHDNEPYGDPMKHRDTEITLNVPA